VQVSREFDACAEFAARACRREPNHDDFVSCDTSFRGRGRRILVETGGAGTQVAAQSLNSATITQTGSPADRAWLRHALRGRNPLGSWCFTTSIDAWRRPVTERRPRVHQGTFYVVSGWIATYFGIYVVIGPTCRCVRSPLIEHQRDGDRVSDASSRAEPAGRPQVKGRSPAQTVIELVQITT
jgi:hypothetical protein